MVADLQHKISASHLARNAYVYVRQSTVRQVFENTESTKRQYALRERALALGWDAENIIVIDSDLGHSGAQSTDREGFQRLVADVSLGKAGIVLGLEVSRLARNSSDWHRLLEICALAGTLIADWDGLYNPAHFNDRLLLGLKGTMSEAELHVLKTRLLGGQMSKAKRGELKFDLPVGFVHDSRDRVQPDPDQQVQKTIRLFFETFARTGSAYTTCSELNKQAILFPRKIRKGPHRGEVVWSRITHSTALRILHNPRYAGVYAYGRRSRKKMPNGQYAYHKATREEWITFIPDAHSGYISIDQYEENQRALHAGAQAHGLERRKSPPREGPALLQGLVVCGKCGNRMTVRYHHRRNIAFPDYVCQSASIERCKPHCQDIPGTSVDKFVSDLLLQMVSPMMIDTAMAVQDELQARISEADDLRRKRIERLRYEAELARRRYLRVDPDNRLVAASLEADWNQHLRGLNEALELYEKQRREIEIQLNDNQRAEILALASSFSSLWNDPATADKDKKRIVRLIIDDVTLQRRQDGIQLDVRFKGGACHSAQLPRPLTGGELRKTPDEVIVEIERLSVDFTDAEVAMQLNTRGFLSGTGKCFDDNRVKKVRYAYGLRSRYDHYKEEGYLTSEELSKRLRISLHEVFQLRDKGLIAGCVTTGRKDLLFAPLSRKEVKEIRAALTAK